MADPLRRPRTAEVITGSLGDVRDSLGGAVALPVIGLGPAGGVPGLCRSNGGSGSKGRCGRRYRCSRRDSRDRSPNAELRRPEARLRSSLPGWTAEGAAEKNLPSPRPCPDGSPSCSCSRFGAHKIATIQRNLASVSISGKGGARCSALAQGRAMTKIILSYRRSDSRDISGRIFDKLALQYGRDSVFIDIDSIPFGVDFRDYLNDALAETDILLAVMGHRWVGDGDPPRIHEENDWVRLEIETALSRGIPVVPILVNGATMPKPETLPKSLAQLAFRNAADVDSGREFHQQVERLMRSMDRLLASGRVQKGPAVPVEARKQPSNVEADGRSADTQPVALESAANSAPNVPGQATEPMQHDRGRNAGSATSRAGIALPDITEPAKPNYTAKVSFRLPGIVPGHSANERDNGLENTIADAMLADFDDRPAKTVDQNASTGPDRTTGSAEGYHTGAGLGPAAAVEQASEPACSQEYLEHGPPSSASRFVLPTPTKLSRTRAATAKRSRIGGRRRVELIILSVVVAILVVMMAIPAAKW